MITFTKYRPGSTIVNSTYVDFGAYWDGVRRQFALATTLDAVDLSVDATFANPGFLDQETRDTHWNNVAHLSFSGSYSNCQIGDSLPIRPGITNVLTGKNSYFVLGAGQWFHYTSNYQDWSYVNTFYCDIVVVGNRRSVVQFKAACSRRRNVDMWYSAVTVDWAATDIGTSTKSTRVYAGGSKNVTVNRNVPKGSFPNSYGFGPLSEVTAQAIRQMMVDLPIDGLSVRWYTQSAHVVTINPPDLPIPSLHSCDPRVLFPPLARQPIWADLARDAYQDLGFYSGNGLKLLTGDLPSITSAAKSTLKQVRSLGGGKWKSVANIYLSFHYGWKLLAMDLRDLSKSLKMSSSVKRCQAVSSHENRFGLHRCRYQVDYDPWAELTSLLDHFVYLFNLDLSGNTAWDSIPYSFVVDWFIQIGDVLNALDNFARLTQKHKVLAACRSIVSTREVAPTIIGVSPTWVELVPLTARYYTRRYGDLIPPSLLPSVSVNPSIQHFVEGAALVVGSH